MKTLASCLNKVVNDGYTENFKVTDDGLQSLETEKIYKPDQVHIVNFFRFEGASDPSESAILYVIETTDGAKGSLTDAYGLYTRILILINSSRRLRTSQRRIRYTLITDHRRPMVCSIGSCNLKKMLFN